VKTEQTVSLTTYKLRKSSVRSATFFDALTLVERPITLT